MKALETARGEILRALPAGAVESVPLAAAAGRWAAADLPAPRPLPSFDTSAMDGYAVRAADTQGATPAAPRRLRLAGRLAAGDPGGVSLAPGEAARIFTGAPLPAGADAVLMQEDARPAEAGGVEVLDAVQPWENIRLAGEDLPAGGWLAREGDLLTAGRLGLLAAAGLAEVPVRRRPRVAVLATGDELVPPGQALPPAGVFESNRLLLATLFRSAGAEVALGPIVPDAPEAVREAIAEALGAADVVVTCGGVSVGEEDHVRAAFQAAGGRLECWRIALKPGKPFAWGRRGHACWFGLPGNPVSAAVTAVLLVVPALRAMQGAKEPLGPRWLGRLGERLVNRGDRRHFVRVRRGEGGRWVSAGLQASHGLVALAAAEGLVDVPPGGILEAGQEAEIIPLA